MTAAFVLGAADALQLSLQLFQSHVPAQVLLALPYALTVLAMSGLLGRDGAARRPHPAFPSRVKQELPA